MCTQDVPRQGRMRVLCDKSDVDIERETVRLSTFRNVYKIVRRIPRGRVITYGEVARLTGLRNGARTVGWALHSLPEGTALPWWRVIRSDGTIAPRPFAAEQRRRLRREGIRFRAGGVVNLRYYGWPSGRR